MLVTGLMAVASGVLRYDGVLHGVASQPRTKVSFDVPPGATDCASRTATQTASLLGGPHVHAGACDGAGVEQVMRAIGFDRVVVVQASTYGRTTRAWSTASASSATARAGSR